MKCPHCDEEFTEKDVEERERELLLFENPSPEWKRIIRRGKIRMLGSICFIFLWLLFNFWLFADVQNNAFLSGMGQFLFAFIPTILALLWAGVRSMTERSRYINSLSL